MDGAKIFRSMVQTISANRATGEVGRVKRGRVSLFITGTDTGVGKTYTAARLLQLLRASGTSCAGMKPICCGDRRDAELLLAAGSDGLTIDEVNPGLVENACGTIVGSLMEKAGYRCRSYPRCLSFSSRTGSNTSLLKRTGGWMVPIHQQLLRQRSGCCDEGADPGCCMLTGSVA